jgi:argininosuccinate synthase
VTPRLVCVWAGDAETWRALAAAAASRGADIVTVTVDVGQGADFGEVRDRALAGGAIRAHVLDVREQFAREYVVPALQSNTLQHDPTARELAARLVASKLDEVAAIEGATPVADSVVVHDTLLGRHGATYTLTTAPADAPPTPAYVEIAFERGVPRAVNGVPMALTELIEILTIIAGHHGVGRLGGLEAPAAVLLIAAYGQLADGSPPDAVTGTVRLKLLKGEHTVVQPS